MEFGRQMRVLRAARGLGLVEMEEITGINRGTLSQYELRGMSVSAKHLGAILTGYGFPPEELREIAFGILEGEIATLEQVRERIAPAELQQAEVAR